MAKFKIRASRFIQQIGQKAPEYVKADPDNPVVVNVEIPPGRKPDPFLEPLEAPDKLKPFYAEKAQRSDRVPTGGPTEDDMRAAQARIQELEALLERERLARAVGGAEQPVPAPSAAPAPADAKPAEPAKGSKRPSDQKPS